MNPNKRYIIRLNAKNKKEALDMIEQLKENIENRVKNDNVAIKGSLEAWKDNDSEITINLKTLSGDC